MANIAANKQGGEFDDELLKNLLEEIKLEDSALDIELIGFNSNELELMMTAIQAPEITEDQSESKSMCQQNECPKCGYKWNSNEQV